MFCVVENFIEHSQVSLIERFFDIVKFSSMTCLSGYGHPPPSLEACHHVGNHSLNWPQPPWFLDTQSKSKLGGSHLTYNLLCHFYITEMIAEPISFGYISKLVLDEVMQLCMPYFEILSRHVVLEESGWHSNNSFSIRHN